MTRTEQRKNKRRKNKFFFSPYLTEEQTVSKWEKGLSVPDADSLQKIADVLDVEVSQLLGAKIEKEQDNNEIAQQLSRINEQLVIKNKRAKKIWTAVVIILLIPVFIYILAIISAIIFQFNTSSSGSSEIDDTVIEEYEDLEYIEDEEIIEE